MIVVSGVKDTGLCGGYWGKTETVGSRRRSKPLEALQIGKTEQTARMRGSVGNIGSYVDTTPTVKKTPQAKKVVTATPQTKSYKKQVTKPQKMVESMDLSQSESEVDTEQYTSMGSKIASEEYGSKEAKVQLGTAVPEDTEQVNTLLNFEVSLYYF